MTAPTPEARFRESLERGQPEFQACAACGAMRHPPREVCHACLSAAVHWRAIRGEGSVLSYIVVHSAPGAVRTTPYCVVHVELDEGVRFTANLLGVDPASAHVGMRVRTVLERMEGGPTLLQFEPIPAPLTPA